MLQGYLQAVGQKGDQNVSVGAMLQLMIDGTYAEVVFERPKYRFDLRQLYVARPKDAGIFRGKVGAQQVVPVMPFRLLELFLVHTKLERFGRDLLAFPGYLHLHEMERSARFGFRGAQAHQQLDQRGQASPHRTELSE